MIGSLANLLHKLHHRLVELSGAQRRPWQAGLGNDPFGGELGLEIAEHCAIDAAADRDPVGTDDRDVHQMPDPSLGSGLNQAPRLVLVALHAARKMQDDVGSLHSGGNPLAGSEVTRHEFDTVPALVAASTQHSNVVPSVLEPRHDEPSEGACAAGNQSFHIYLSLSHTWSMGCHFL